MDVGQFAQLGVAGLVIFWFMWRVEGRLDRGERAMDRLSKSILLDLVSRPDATDAIKEQARELMKQIPPANVVPERELAGAGVGR